MNAYLSRKSAQEETAKVFQKKELTWKRARTARLWAREWGYNRIAIHYGNAKKSVFITLWQEPENS